MTCSYVISYEYKTVDNKKTVVLIKGDGSDITRVLNSEINSVKELDRNRNANVS